MSFTTLALSTEGGIATLTLTRPEKLNAFSLAMGEELLAALDALDADDRVRAVIVTGAGRGFCAGMDLDGADGAGNVFGIDETVDPDGPEGAAIRDRGGLVTLRLFRMKKPVIAAINGPAVGVGATMTLAMDARALSERARIGFVFARIGVTLESCASWFLPRVVGMETALDWALSGRIVDAAEAHAAGFARHLVAPDALLDRAEEIARRFAEGTAPVSVAANRQLLWRMAGAAHPMEAHRAESRTMRDTSTGDGREGVRAFLEKRPPRFASRVSKDMPQGLDWDGEPPYR